MIYFDHNATAPLHPIARQAWLEASEKFIGNPSSPHRIGGRADMALEEARHKLAIMIGCLAHEIVWTSGATESNNQVFHHFASTLPSDATVCISAIEHPSVVESAVHYFGKRVRSIPVSRNGVIDLDWLVEELALRRPGVVAVMAANNVTGIIQPWEQIAEECRRWGVAFFCDAVQWIGKEWASKLHTCDLVSGCAHKIGGPRGIGFLKCSLKGEFKPMIYGGPQEENRRAGTENVAGAIALVATLEARNALLGTMDAQHQMRDNFVSQLVSEIPEAEIVGGSERTLWNTVAARLPEIDCRQRWVVKLDKFGVAVSTGSACSSGKEEPSPVLLAMSYTPGEAGRVLRFSSGWETTEKDWEILLECIKRAAEELRPVP
ncbi:MAG: Cysteine desulfurase [Verrucomicrobiales bacterium]|nr:Cysteine desulfurase [Verrucomicrobiales bacterium]